QRPVDDAGLVIEARVPDRGAGELGARAPAGELGRLRERRREVGLAGAEAHVAPLEQQLTAGGRISRLPQLVQLEGALEVGRGVLPGERARSVVGGSAGVSKRRVGAERVPRLVEVVCQLCGVRAKLL